MRIEQVEIYSDASNAAVLRHPGRRFPGCLLQGDTLNNLVKSLAQARNEVDRLSEDAAENLRDVHDHLTELLAHYTGVLKEHGLGLPYFESERH